jgi:ubiquinone/menaquinone biosynthesis C-methylase UbiE
MLEVNFMGKPVGRSDAVEQLGLAPGMRVADVGCGPGRLTLPIAEAVGAEGEVVALDMQQGMLDKMMRWTAAAGLRNVRPLLGGAGEGHLPEQYFDRALLSTVLGEIPDRERALSEIARALKPNGFLLVVEVLGDPHYQFKSKVLELADRVGLKPGDYYPKWYGYAIRLYRVN